jgi:hypothetical protein
VPLFHSHRERNYWLAAALLVLGTWSTLYWARFVANWLRDRGWITFTMWLIFAVAAAGVVALVVRGRPRRLELLVLVPFAALYAGVVLSLRARPEEALHFVQYGWVGGLLFFALGERRRRLPPGSWLGRPGVAALLAILFTLAAGWADEGIQYLLPNRYYDLRDVAFNAMAGALAVAGATAWRWAWGRG